MRSFNSYYIMSHKQAPNSRVVIRCESQLSEVTLINFKSIRKKLNFFLPSVY